MNLIRICSNCGYSEFHDSDDNNMIGQNSGIKCPNCDEYKMIIERKE